MGALIFIFSTCFCSISFAVDPGLQVYGGVLFSELVHEGGEIFKELPLSTYSERYANSNNNDSDDDAIAHNYYAGNRGQNAVAHNYYAGNRGQNAVAHNYYAGNSGGCFGGECVVQCKEQDEMVREKQLSQVGDYLFFVCLSSLHCIVFFFSSPGSFWRLLASR